MSEKKQYNFQYGSVGYGNLNYLAATRIMGWEVSANGPTLDGYYMNSAGEVVSLQNKIFNPAFNLLQAFDVIEMMRKKNFRLLYNDDIDNRCGTHVQFAPNNTYLLKATPNIVCSRDEPPASGITLAAVMTVTGLTIETLATFRQHW